MGVARSYLERSVRYLGLPFKGKPSIPLMNGFDDPAEKPGEGEKALGRQVLAAEEDTEWSSQARRIAATVPSSRSAERSISAISARARR